MAAMLSNDDWILSMLRSRTTTTTQRQGGEYHSRVDPTTSTSCGLSTHSENKRSNDGGDGIPTSETEMSDESDDVELSCSLDVIRWEDSS